MARPKKPSELIKTKSGEWYKLTVFRIVDKDEFGRPENCVMIPDDRVVEVDDGDEFMTAYVPKVFFDGEKEKR